MRARFAALLAPVALMAAAAAAHAQLPVTVYETVSATDPVARSRLLVTAIDARQSAIDLTIVAPNRSHPTGHVRGLALREGNLLTLRVANFIDSGRVDVPPLCTMVIDVRDQEAQVLSADACSNYAGTAASFVEQGQHLMRVR